MRAPVARWSRRRLVGWCVAIPLVIGSVVGFRAWQLRHSYDVYMSVGRPRKSLLYSPGVLEQHRETVRKWIASELLGTETVVELDYGRTVKQMALLHRLGQEEDLELLWRRAEMGFPIGEIPPGETFVPGMDPASLQTKLCRRLVLHLRFSCERVAGGEKKGGDMLKDGFAQRGIAPEVRKAQAAVND